MATRLKRNGSATSAAMAETPRRVVYVYGITPAPKKPIAAPRHGIDGLAAVVPVSADGLICWVSSVDAVEFGDELSERMENLDWLATVGVRHQQVVAALAEQTEILPARFGTVFHSEDKLRADLKRRKRTILSTLKRVAGADEWGVKVFADPARLSTAASVQAASGREYLQRKAAVLQQKEPHAAPEVMKLATALRKASVAATAVGKVSGGQRNLIWQGAFLVRRKSRTKFNHVLKQFASKWKGEKIVECTGPWPPYSFVSRDGR